jgi:hypothetical protein
MSEVINFLSRIKVKTTSKSTDYYYDIHEGALDFCEETFPDGVVIITIADGKLQMSSTVEDREVIEEMLVSALEVVYDENEIEEE